MIRISPSLLSADLARLAEAVDIVADEAHYIHCDIMDGHFVPNLTFGAPVVAAIKRASAIPLDVHLMIESPGKWIDDYIKAGLDEKDFLTFHYEAEPDSEEVIKRIRDSGVRPGIAIKPKTEYEQFEYLIKLVDQVLIMTVEPGFGGQEFMQDKLIKVKKIRQAFPSVVIGVDGGIDINTASVAVQAGADLLVAGTAIYGQPDPGVAIKNILR
ncbi:MAG: ribulose-phosphate 3-epimerase [Candidatus Hatepunaea meridiana]|nr:ribulose-phosphate 3-epimerase [Candidatus Hatepunaea meridiana]